ncbi:hypothetical protein [Mycoplasma buteonis]|uniref:hypothetical protein n=1 Tax=Mycoplasma buteonis TaxID=171280 RepID=UPI000567FA5E|nr:hypothetical protein [Mycoplasma buteonis]
MNKIKLPNMNELGLSVKKILWSRNWKSYREFRDLEGDKITSHIISYLEKKNLPNTNEMLRKYQKLLIDWAFLNYYAERRLKTSLENKGYTVKIPSDFEDAVYKIDLIATKKGHTYYFQLKSYFVPKEETQKQFKRLEKKIKENGGTAIFVWYDKKNIKTEKFEKNYIIFTSKRGLKLNTF